MSFEVGGFPAPGSSTGGGGVPGYDFGGGGGFPAPGSGIEGGSVPGFPTPSSGYDVGYVPPEEHEKLPLLIIIIVVAIVIMAIGLAACCLKRCFCRKPKEAKKGNSNDGPDNGPAEGPAEDEESKDQGPAKHEKSKEDKKLKKCPVHDRFSDVDWSSSDYERSPEEEV